MKAIFKTMSVAAAVIMTAGCGNNQGKQAEQTVAVVEELPSVAVQQVFVKEVPQVATYTSTIQPYVKNNIVPQTAGRITQGAAPAGSASASQCRGGTRTSQGSL